ncbi:MAG: iron-sulfur cluster assembly scaffold protein [Candidatus Hadarchaeaceae archaeon]
MSKDEEKSTSGYEKFMELVKAEMLKVHSEKTVEHALYPRNMEPMADADGHAKITGPCGDTMEIFLKIKQGKVVAASFLTSGCCSTIACGSITTELVKGKELAEVKKISSDSILKALGGLPELSVHCSVLAANTLKAAVESYLKNRGS